MLSSELCIVNDEPTFITLQNVAISPCTDYVSNFCELATVIPDDNMSCYEKSMKDDIYLDIIVQPVDSFRYRYKSEKGSHGGIKGVNNSRSKKSFPTVELKNCPSSLREEVVIEVSLYTNNNNGLEEKLHVYELAGKKCRSGKIQGTLDKNFTVMFQSLAITTIKKEEVLDTLKTRKILDYEHNGISYNEATVEAEAQEEMKNINLDSAKLCFEAFLNDTPLCDKVFSTPINNQKSAASGDLKIVRISRRSGKCSGGDDMMLFCEKVKKDDIKVRFSETENETLVWEAYVDLNPADVHHQFGMAFRTPKYCRTGVHRKVDMQLVRPSDGRCSEPRIFEYIPDANGIINSPNKHLNESITACHSENKNVFSRKRKRMNPEEDTKASEPYLDSSSVMDSPQSIIDEKEHLQDFHLGIFSENWNMSLMEYLLSDENENWEDITNTGIEGQSDEFGDPSSMSLPFDYLIAQDNSITLNEEPVVFADSLNHVANSMDSLSLASKQEMKSAKEMQKIKFSKNFTQGMNEIFKNRETSTFLLYAPSLIPLEDENGNSMLQLAIMEQNENLVLIKKMLEIVSEDLINHQNKFKETALHLAVRGNYLEVLFLLLFKGGNPNLADRDGNSCLHLAATYGHINCLKMLILPSESKRTWKYQISDVDGLNYDGMSALHLAIVKGFKDSVNFLLKCKADVNLPENKCGQSPLHLAIQQPDLLPIILKQPKVDVSAKDFRGYTAIYLACMKVGKSFESISAHLQNDTDKITKFLENFHQNEGEGYSSGGEAESGGESTDSSDFEDAVEELESRPETCEGNSKTISKDDLLHMNGKKSNLMKIEEELIKFLDMNDNWKKLADLVDLNTEHMTFYKVAPGQTVLKKIKALYHPCDLKVIINILNSADLEEGAKILQDNS